jgi:hypothetical protein
VPKITVSGSTSLSYCGWFNEDQLREDWSWPHSNYCPRIPLEGLRKITDLSQNGRCPVAELMPKLVDIFL